MQVFTDVYLESIYDEVKMTVIYGRIVSEYRLKIGNMLAKSKRKEESKDIKQAIHTFVKALEN